MKKYYLIAFIILLTVFLFIDKEFKQACINNQCFDLEVVTSRKDQIKGLSGRETLDLNKGMLFIYNQEQLVSIWMKEMKFSLDIIWINSKKEVVHIERGVLPCGEDYCANFSAKAKYVLEVNANQDIAIGDQVDLK